MSGEMLSQDEIDALLRGETVAEQPAQPESDLAVTDYLSEMEQDALGEIGNISFGSSATALSTLLNQKVEITTPTVSIISQSKLEDEFPDPYVAIQVEYTEGFSGSNILVIKQSDAAIIANLMLGGDGTAPSEMMDEIQLSAVQEAMNQMMGSAATSMSSVFNKRVDISPPSINLLNILEGEGKEAIPQQNLLVKISFRLTIGTLIDSDIMQVVPVDFAKSLVNELFSQNGGEQEQQDVPTSVVGHDTNSEEAAPVKELESPIPFADPVPVQEPVEQRGMAHHHVQSGAAAAVKTNVQPASFSEFSASPAAAQDTKNLNMLLDIPLQVTVELGRTSRSVKDILELGAGSIIELDKLAGEPVDILVNNRLIAQGEVVVIDENFGVRVTDIVSQTDRLKRLK